MGEVNNGIIIIILNTLTPSNLGQLGIWDGERRGHQGGMWEEWERKEE